MPMIEFRFNPGKISHENAVVIGSKLESALRRAIGTVRSSTSYGITVEGDPFGPIAHNQPDLRMYIFYHQEWNFTASELEDLATGMQTPVRCMLDELKLDTCNAVIRFYSRAGHAGARVR